MAVTSNLRRVPWAAWAAAAARDLLAARIRGFRAPHPHPRRAGCPALFSSLSTPQPGAAAAAEAQLLRVINFEISCAQQDCKKRDWTKELGGKFPFQIQDKEGTSGITLTKRDQKEQIDVEVFLPSPVDPEDQNGDQEGQAEDDNRRSQYYIPLMVKIHKGLVSLEISCSSYPDELVIESLAFGPSDESALSSVEAKLCNLPEELQKAFYSYLRSRGISDDVTNFVHAYMINKECHEYLSWLRKLKSSIKC
ncbi:hypothetical protein EJB05_35824, partial [Eragrostis curvula]